MKKYAVNGSQAVASPTDSVLGITSATTVRPEIYHFLLGCQATPADNALNWLLQRYTAAGSGDAVTPHALDPADPAALSSAIENHGTEPTYTSGAILLEVSINQRASLPWYAREGREIKLPATAANGVGLQPVHGSFTGVVDVAAHYQE